MSIASRYSGQSAADQASRYLLTIDRLLAREVALTARIAALTAERDALRVPEQRGTT